MTDTPRWDLAAAESAIASLDLAREVGAAVGVPAVVSRRANFEQLCSSIAEQLGEKFDLTH